MRPSWVWRVQPAGSVAGGRGAAAYLIDYAGEANLASFRFAYPDLRIQAAEESFEVDGRSFHAGSFIPPDDPTNPPTLYPEGSMLETFRTVYARLSA